MSEKKTIKKITASIILSWIFGFIFLILGVSLLSKSTLIGLVIIILSIFIMPYTNKLTSDKFNFEISTGLKFLFVIIIIIMTIIANPSEATTNQDENVSQVNINEKPKDQNQNLKENYDIGEPFTLGDFKISIDDIKYVENIYESENSFQYLESEKDKIYAILDLSVKNISSDTKTFNLFDLEIMGSEGYSYNEKFIDRSYLDKPFSANMSIPANITKKGQILFEIPYKGEKPEGYKLLINLYEFFDKDKTLIINLPSEDIWFSTTDKIKPDFESTFILKDRSVSWYSYSSEGQINSLKFKITNTSTYPIDYTMTGNITNENNTDINLSFEEDSTLSLNMEESDEIFITFTSNTLTEIDGYTLNANLLINDTVVNNITETFSLNE